MKGFEERREWWCRRQWGTVIDGMWREGLCESVRNWEQRLNINLYARKLVNLEELYELYSPSSTLRRFQ